MTQSLPRWLSIPIVGVACLLVFLAYVLLTTGYQSLTCERFAPGSVQCEAIDTYLFGFIAQPQQQFQLQTVEVTSELSDRTPRGGVRFRHTLTLKGDTGEFASDPFQSPLSGAAIKQQVQSFMAGEGPLLLTFQHSTSVATLFRSGALALLLSIVAWSFWDIRWPRSLPRASSHPAAEEFLE